MTSFDVPRNQAQLPAGINATRLGLQFIDKNTVGNTDINAIYTCPPGKNTIIEAGFEWEADAYGSGTNMTFGIQRFGGAFEKIGETLTFAADPPGSPGSKVIVVYDLHLFAGDKLGTRPSDTAVNSTVGIVMNLDEFDV